METHPSLLSSCSCFASSFFKLGLRLQKSWWMSHTSLRLRIAGGEHPGCRHSPSLKGVWGSPACTTPAQRAAATGGRSRMKGCHREPQNLKTLEGLVSFLNGWEGAGMWLGKGRCCYGASGPHLQSPLLLSHYLVNLSVPKQCKCQVPYFTVKDGECMKSTRHSSHLITTPCSSRPSQ